jgi:DNA-binding LacI/PurR family transcriptional regulator/signal transduction histidine kinase/ActR/RegA family two-component response regulator
LTESTTPPAQTLPEEGSRSPAAALGSRRLTIAVLLDNANFFEGCYEAKLREALDAKCRQLGHNLVLVYGGPLDAPGPTDAANNTIFRTLRPDSFDGVIVVSSMLAAFCGPDPVARLMDGYRPASLCSVGLALPGVASLVLDNHVGMEAAVEHLVHDHGVRRPVFLAGTSKNPEAQARFAAYRTVLARHDIPFDPALVVCGFFMPKQGRAAMDSLLAAGVPFDAVVAANDNMALGAIEALRKWGRRVPRDVPVTGFDDLPLAGLGNPPLTTVAQPLGRMADLAIETVVAQLEGREVPACVVLPSRFVCRRSCGCEFEANPRGAPKPTAPVGLVERLQALRPKLASVLRAPPEEAVSVSHRLIESLLAEHAGAERAFPKAVADLLEDLGDDTTCHTVLREAIAYLREELADPGAGWLERACFEGLNLVASASTTHEERRRLSLEDSYATLLKISEHASVAFDLASLRQTLSRDLPAAGVRTMYLSCAVDETASLLAPAVCLVDGEPADAPETGFPASRLLPPSALSRDPRRTFLVFPLAVESSLLGVAAFDHADGVRSYAVFRNELTGVIKSLRLHQELVQKTTLHERSVQERLAATKRMESLSVLAGGVAHDLNNALGPLVALPDLILRELQRLPDDGPAVRKISADIEIIKTASLRAAQTIKDLLTLGRQGRTAKEVIDLHRVVKSCVAECSLRLVQDKSRSVRLAADYFAKPLAVRGSESQLARAIGNLLRNALEAINGDGKVMLKTRLEHLAGAVAAFETIPAGAYAVVTVTDDGCGIDPLELPRVFEPFWSSKRAGDSSGSGLGLAIVHGVVKEHEGFIDVSSLLGKGSSFSLYLPLAQPARTVAKPTPAAPRGPAKILVVDDEDVQLRTCRRALRELGHDVDTVPSGMRAYQIFKQAAPTGKSPYDLLVIDMVLGETLDGLQILELIHQLFPDQKAILASGNAPSDRAELAVRRGLLWLAKPYTIEALTHAVERVFLQTAPRSVG